MTEDGEGKREPPEDEGNRGIENAVMLGFFVVLVAAGIWLLGTMADVRKAQKDGRTNMRTTILSIALVVLIGGADAFAQGSSSVPKNSGGAGSGGGGGGVIQAPVGHRQPRAGDVPNEKNLSDPNDPLSKENAALDRKIKSICRGC